MGTTNNDIAAFAEKYIDFFENVWPDNIRARYMIFDDMEFPRKCEAFGFEMDCGKSLTDVYGHEVFCSARSLLKIIHELDDIKVVGSAIFSQWRFYNHWSYGGPSDDMVQWFIMMFRHLKALASAPPKTSTVRQHIVFLTGAGVSVESGLSTFRGKGGMWTNKEWAYLASTEALYNDTQRCLDFYNMRRKQLAEVEPNEAHRLIAALEKEYDVTVITQNVDNLHERAGSTQVIHLHGELSKVCSMDNRTTCVKEYPLTTPIMTGDKADDGAQLRPYIVMFGEYVDSMDVATKYVKRADIFVVVGTSLKVYPAANFINYAHREVPKFVIDPGEMEQCERLGFTHFKTGATEGMKKLVEVLKEL
jgi:NAD-dependent deacetylase